MHNKRSLVHTVTTLALLLACSGCVSNQSPGPEATDAERPILGAPPQAFPSLTIDTEEFTGLGSVIRHIGETAGGGAVLMAEMENWPAPKLQLKNTRYVTVLERLVAGYRGRVQTTPHYAFVYQQGYEQLAELTIDEARMPSFANTRISFALGAGTDLFNALALLGDALNGTIVADNKVAEAWCGELFLDDAPVSAVLEALLKSALLPPSAIEVEYAETYILVRSSENPNRQDTCLNRDALTAPQQAQLASTVSLQLPRAQTGTVFREGALPLSKTLSDLTRQLGVTITADAATAALPVNVATMHNLALEDALNLLIWQWPVAAYGYRVEGDGIRITKR